MIPPANIDMREIVSQTCGHEPPWASLPSLYSRPKAQSQRESYRHFLGGTDCGPRRELIAEELSDKLEQEIEIQFPQTLDQRHRRPFEGVFVAHVKAGIEPKDAARIAGLPTDFRMAPKPAPVARTRSSE